MALQEKNYVPVLAYGGSSDVTANQTITSSAAQAFVVGANGATNPVLTINCNTASVATGISITGAAAAGGVALAVTSSGTNEGLKIDAKGSGTIVLAGTSTGAITLTTATTCASTLTSTGNFVVGSNKLVVTAASGNTAIAGTLAVTGVATFTAAPVFTANPLFFHQTDASAATISVTAAMNGGSFLATKGSGTQTYTLPAAAAGLKYTFICGHADGEILINPTASDDITITTFAAVGADADTAIVTTTGATGIKNTAATNAVGDSVTLVSDGTKWFGVGITSGIWAAQ